MVMNPEQLDISLGPRGAAGISRIIDGKALAAQLRRQVKERVACLEQTHGIRPGLAVILVGENPSSRIYVRNKTTCAAEVGIASRQISLPATIGQQELVAKVASLNEDPGIDGVLVQMPLPRQIDPAAVIEAVDPAKDVDGFHPLNAGRLVSGREGLVPCTALACMLLLKEMVGDLAGLDALVLGRSDIVGKPTALLLLRENCTVTIAHSRTRGLPVLCRRADILIVAIGKPLFVQGEWIKSGAAVVDVGINRIVENGRSRIVGDVDFAAAAPVAAAITPVPGGVGPMTIACLLANTVRAACKRRGIASPEFAALDRST